MADGLEIAMRDAGAELAETFSSRGYSGPRTRYGTVVANNGATLDVALAGGTVPGVPMTTACVGARKGDRVLLTVDGPLVTATGVIATADNGPYVRLYSEGAYGFCDYREVAGVAVCVTCDWLSVTAKQSKKLGTIPVGLRPRTSAIGVCYVRGYGGIGQISVDTNGIVSVWSNTSDSGYFGGSVTFPLP